MQISAYLCMYSHEKLIRKIICIHLYLISLRNLKTSSTLFKQHICKIDIFNTLSYLHLETGSLTNYIAIIQSYCNNAWNNVPGTYVHNFSTLSSLNVSSYWLVLVLIRKDNKNLSIIFTIEVLCNLCNTYPSIQIRY